ncbi:MAG: hypothetical protein ACPGVF_04700 [Flavobacteriaceae bacterium]
MKYLLHGFGGLILSACTSDFDQALQEVRPPDKDFQEVQVFGGTNEDIAHNVVATPDGGFAVIGNTQSSDGDFSFKTTNDSDFFVFKFDANNALEWTKTYGGTGDDRGYDLVALKQGGYVLLGYSSSSDGDASRNEGMHDHWVIRIDNQGALLWEKSFGFAGHDHAYNIIETSDGGFFFNGFLDVTASGGAGQDGKSPPQGRHGVGEFWAQKIDAQGNLLWRNYYGGTNNDRSYDAIQTSDGNYLITGSSESTDVDITQPKGSYDIWVVKISPRGKILWERSFGGSAYDSAAAVIENPLGNYLVVGQSLSSDGDIEKPLGNSDIVLVEVGQEGNQATVKNIGTPNFDAGQDLLPLLDGSLLVLGNTVSNTSLSAAQTNENKALVLHQLFPFNQKPKQYVLDGLGVEQPYALAQKQDGTVVVVGSTTSSDPPFQPAFGAVDIFIAFWN